MYTAGICVIVVIVEAGRTSLGTIGWLMPSKDPTIIMGGDPPACPHGISISVYLHFHVLWLAADDAQRHTLLFLLDQTPRW